MQPMATTGAQLCNRCLAPSINCTQFDSVIGWRPELLTRNSMGHELGLTGRPAGLPGCGSAALRGLESQPLHVGPNGHRHGLHREQHGWPSAQLRLSGDILPPVMLMSPAH